MQPSLLFDQGGGAIPYSERLAPGQDVRISSITAKWNGAAASGTFLACLSLYSQSGVLLSRSFPSQQFAAGDSGVVTYAPPLGASAGGAAAGSGSGYPAIIELPIFPRKGAGNFDSAQWTYTIDAAAPGGGYAENTFDLAEQTWLVNLGPEGSAWKILVVGAKGNDYGKLDVRLATDPPSAFFAPNVQYPQDPTSITFVTLQTIDFYAAVAAAYPNTANATVFQIGGTDGAVGTAFTAGAGIYAGQSIWDGGPGMNRISILTNGQNGASGGFRQRISQVWLVRVDEGLVA